MSRVTLITGGARSGKSSFALRLAASCRKRVLIATAEGSDEEMRRRIEAHRRERQTDWETVEAPLLLAEALRSVPWDTDIVIVDCLTVWLGNLLHHLGSVSIAAPPIVALEESVAESKVELVLVTNEVGMGIVPDNSLARDFRDLAGLLNQRLASRADRVALMVSGQAMWVKGGDNGATRENT